MKRSEIDFEFSKPIFDLGPEKSVFSSLPLQVGKFPSRLKLKGLRPLAPAVVIPSYEEHVCPMFLSVIHSTTIAFSMKEEPLTSEARPDYVYSIIEHAPA